jgi:hypothetical protein
MLPSTISDIARIVKPVDRRSNDQSSGLLEWFDEFLRERRLPNAVNTVNPNADRMVTDNPGNARDKVLDEFRPLISESSCG